MLLECWTGQKEGLFAVVGSCCGSRGVVAVV